MKATGTHPLFTARLVESQLELETFVRSLLPGHPSDIQDVVQNTNLALIEHEADYDPARPFVPWLLAFARRQVMAYRTAHARSPLLFDDEIAFAAAERLPAALPEEDGRDTAALLRKLDHCKKQLPPESLDLLDRRYRRREPVADIARSRRAKPNTVTQTLARLRKRLGDCIRNACRLEAEGGEPLTEDQEALADIIERDALPPEPQLARLRQALHEQATLDFWLNQNRVDRLLALEAKGLRQPAARRRLFPAALKAAALLTALVACFGWAAIRLTRAPARVSVAAVPVPVPAAVAAVPTNAAPAAVETDLTETVTAPAVTNKSEGTTQMNKSTALAAAAVATALTIARPATTQAADKYWTGAASTAWDTSSANWKDAAGNATTFSSGDNAIFADGASATTVNASGTLTVGTLTVSNETAAFTFGGSGKIGTMAAFNKFGAGTLNISRVTDTYACDVLLAGGTTVLSGNNDAADVTYGGLGNPRVARTITVSNATLKITGANAFAGGGTSTKPILTDLHVINGSLLATKENMGQCFGNVYFDNASVSYSSGAMTWRRWGSMSFGYRDLAFAGSKAYTFNEVSTNSGFVLSKWTNTTITVADITGDSKSDVTFNLPFFLTASRTTPSDGINTRFAKAGPGTMELTGSAQKSDYTGDVSVAEGTLLVSIGAQANDDGRTVNPTNTALGNTRVPRTLFIGTNATLALTASDVMGSSPSRPEVKTVISGGTLTQAVGVVNAFGPVVLDNATLAYSGRNASPDGRIWGTFIFNDDVTFTGTNAYTLGGVNDSSIKVGSADKTAYLNVADITGDDRADLTIQMPILDRPVSWSGAYPATPSKLGKAGAGTLVLSGGADTVPLSGSMASAFTGDIDIIGGTLEVAVGKAYPFHEKTGPLGDPSIEDRRVTVRDGAMLYYSKSDINGQLCYSNKLTLAVSNATFRIQSGCCDSFGSLDLYDADFLYADGISNTTGSATERNWGVGGFGKKVRLDGTEPYDFAVCGACNLFSLGYLTDYERPSAALVKGKTEWEVCDITGDGRVDATFEPVLQDLPDYWRKTTAGDLIYPDSTKETVKYSCGLLKTGEGTLRLTGANTYTGDTQVAGGALLIDSPSFKSPVTVDDGGFIGGTGSVPRLTIEANGGFEALTSQARPLNVAALTLPAGAVKVNIRNVTRADYSAIRVPLVRAGAVTGTFQAGSWSVYVDGVYNPHNYFSVKQEPDGALWVVYSPGGTRYIFR